MAECFCESEKPFMEVESISESSFGIWMDKRIKIQEVEYEKNAFVIDERGYLRFGDANEMQCLDHSDNTKINFCPFCGKKFNSQ